MENKELVLKTHKIDWLKLIKLALNKEGWGERYVIHQYGTFNIRTRIKSFNFDTNTADFKFEFDYRCKGSSIWSYDLEEMVQYHINNFSIEDFKLVVEKMIKRRTMLLIKKEAREFAKTKYRDLHHDEATMDQIEEHGDIDDYNNAESLSSYHCDDIQTSIEEDVLEILNEEYEDKVEEFANNSLKTGNEVPEDLFNFYQEVNK